MTLEEWFEKLQDENFDPYDVQLKYVLADWARDAKAKETQLKELERRVNNLHRAYQNMVERLLAIGEARYYDTF